MFLSGISILLVAVGFVSAAQVALVYENEAAVKAGKFTIASVVTEGVLVPASLAMKSGGNLYIGPVGNSVYKASLVRLDNDLDLAVMKLTEPLTSNDLQNTHKIKSQAVLAFLPQAAVPVEAVSVSSVSSPGMEGMFAFKIDGSPVESGVIALKSNSLRKSKFNLELVINSTSSVWNISVEVKSDPKLGFWKQGRHTGLNDVPRYTFTYDHQSLFVPLKGGKSIVIPVEAHYIDKDKTYVWTISVKTKQGSATQTANVKFN